MATATPAVSAPGLTAPAAGTPSDKLKDRWGYAALAAVVLFVLGVIVLGGSTPDSDAGARKISTYYTDHATRQTWAAVSLAVSALVFALFGSSLLRSLRRVAGTDAQWPWLAFVGSVVMSGGMLLAAGIHISLSQDAKHLPPAAAAAMNTADSAPWVAVLGGLTLMSLGTVAATWRARGLPRWFAVVGAVLAVGTITPAGFFVGLALLLWLVALGVMISTRGLAARASS